MRPCLASFVVMAALAAGIFAQQPQPRWFPFNPSGAVVAGTAADASDLLIDKPGDDLAAAIDRRGRIITGPDGYFHAGKSGRRVKFFGTNLTFGSAFPPNAEAPAQPGEYREGAPDDAAEQLAVRLARMGVNLVRLHHMDNQNRPRGIWDPAYPNDTQHLDALQLRRLDYLIYQLKRHGIYTNLNLHVSRLFRAGDGVKESDLFQPGNYNKGATQFDPVMVALQKKYASDILGHVNLYTGLRLADDPAVAFVEVTNEDSLFWEFRVDHLNHDPAKAETLPPYYNAELDRLWNDWLKKRYRSQPALEAAWRPQNPAEFGPPVVLADGESLDPGTIARPKRAELKRFTPTRAQDLMQFYFDTERAYYDGMLAHLRGTVRTKALITGTAPFWFYPLDTEIQSVTDFLDGHIYFDHPSWPKVRPWSRVGWVMKNRPFASDPFENLFKIAAGAVAGKPYTVTETNQPYPNEYEAEWLVWMATFGNFQDWDGVLQFDYGASANNYFPDVSRGFFGIAGNAVKAAEMPLAARIFLNSQNRPATGRLELVAGHNELALAGPNTSSASFFEARGVAAAQAFRTGIRVKRFTEAAGPRYSEASGAPPLVASDNRELVLDRAKPSAPLYTVDSAALQLLSGFASGREVKMSRLSVALAADSAPFAVLAVQPVDGRVLDSSTRLLISVLSRQTNTGMVWNSERTSVDDRWGGPPSLIERVAGRLRLSLKKGAAYRVYSLDNRGQRKEQVGGGTGQVSFEFDTERDKTVWYEVTSAKN